jgi:poly(3-hydroxybutyrate) depolymerase/photosystem II stability/assembly factor-like uncharacterized protein
VTGLPKGHSRGRPSAARTSELRRGERTFTMTRHLIVAARRAALVAIVLCAGFASSACDGSTDDATADAATDGDSGQARPIDAAVVDAGSDATLGDADTEDARAPDGGPRPTDAGRPDAADGAADAADAADGGPCVTAPGLSAGQPGTFSNQCIAVEGGTRAFFLHVPPSYTPGSAWPLLVDFHGTGFPVSDGTLPEELWATSELEQIADEQGFIVVRPRSLSFVDTDGQVIYHWDANPGDLELNKRYAHALVAFLESHYGIDPARVYASGFSNGTNMVAQFVGDTPAFFGGYAFLGGGIWNTYTPATTPTSRIYGTTGYRDQLRPEALALGAWLSSFGFPSTKLWERETNGGHHIYGWQFRELFGWLDRAERPPLGALRNGWTAEALPSASSSSLLHLAKGSIDGQWFASGSSGSIWSRSKQGTWALEASLLPSVPTLALDGICTSSAGAVVATGDGVVAVLDAPGGSWHVDKNAGLDPSDPEDRLEAVTCVTGTTLVGGGPSYAQVSTDLGSTWSPANISVFGSTPSVTNIARSAAGTWLAVGAVYIGRSTDGLSFTPAAQTPPVTWLYGVASSANSRWWVTGEEGSLSLSQDDGQTWQQQAVPTLEDLYAVAFWNASRGIAVGLHGAAVLTTDGGATWKDVSTGLDAMNSDVTWLDASTVLVVGGNGTALKLAVP